MLQAQSLPCLILHTLPAVELELQWLLRVGYSACPNSWRWIKNNACIYLKDPLTGGKQSHHDVDTDVPSWNDILGLKHLCSLYGLLTKCITFCPEKGLAWAGLLTLWLPWHGTAWRKQSLGTTREILPFNLAPLLILHVLHLILENRFLLLQSSTINFLCQSRKGETRHTHKKEK